MKYSGIISRVSEDTGIPAHIVDKTYKAFWLCIKEHIKKLPLKEELSEEEFSSLKTCFNIPSIGKLTCTRQGWLNTKKRLNYIKDLRKRHEEVEENQAHVQ